MKEKMKKLKPGCSTTTYDLCEVRWIPHTSIPNKKVPHWISTPAQNLSYSIIRRKMEVYSKDPNYSRSKFIPVKNGKSPLTKLNKNEKQQVSLVL
jgi:hypothetical protein